MTIRDLFNIILKILGIFFIKDILATIPQLLSISLYLTKPDVAGAVFTLVTMLFMLLTANRSSPPQAASSSAVAASSAARPTLTPLPVAAATSRRASASAAPLPDVNGISCDALESTIFHIHVHLAIFVDGQEQGLPLGVGIGQPWQVEDSAEAFRFAPQRVVLFRIEPSCLGMIDGTEPHTLKAMLPDPVAQALRRIRAERI